MSKRARFLAFDISTTATSAGVSDGEGEEGSAALPVRGATSWQGQPAIEPATLPDMLRETLEELQRLGWEFSTPGHLCASVRQHDMVLVDRDGRVLIPFITWQNHAATAEVERLREMGAETVVGRIEPRFILPKLIWALARDPSLRARIGTVTTTGDYAAWKLTGASRLSTSDALSNALLDQTTKQIAAATIKGAGLDPAWFPRPIQSGKPVGEVQPGSAGDSWSKLARILRGWTVRAGLGDNHAGGVGSGLDDYRTLVISLGSSGTVIRKCRPGSSLAGNATRFEYFEDTLLFEMVADCAVWYDRFVKRFIPTSLALTELNALALATEGKGLRYVAQEEREGRWEELYAPDWNALDRGTQTASTQASIAVHMLRLVEDLLREVQDASAPPITRFVITGGLSRSAFLEGVLLTGLRRLCPEARVFVSGRSGPLANKAAVLGALFTAMVGTAEYPSLGAVFERWRSLKLATAFPRETEERIESFIAAHL